MENKTLSDSVIISCVSRIVKDWKKKEALCRSWKYFFNQHYICFLQLKTDQILIMFFEIVFILFHLYRKDWKTVGFFFSFMFLTIPGSNRLQLLINILYFHHERVNCIPQYKLFAFVWIADYCLQCIYTVHIYLFHSSSFTKHQTHKSEKAQQNTDDLM